MYYLNCHSWFSLRYGTFSVTDLCKLARDFGVVHLALTDINNTSGCLEFLKTAASYNIKPIVGIDFRNGATQEYVGIAKNNKGFRQLNEHLSRHLHQNKNFENDAPFLSDCAIIYPLEKVIRTCKKDFRVNEFIGVSVDSLRKLKFSDYRYFSDKLVLLHSVSFRNKKDFNAHRLLRAIDNNTLLSKLPEREQGNFSHQMISPEVVETEFEDFPQLLENTRKLVNACEVHFSFGKQNRNLQKLAPSSQADVARLRELCKANLLKRYPNAGFKVYRRVAKELKVIIKLGFVSYFLINYEIVNYAKSQNFPFIGRGSGANSIIAYIIGITNVDPIELDLYFERFINENRSSPPDFDIDFSWKDRNEVTRFIFEKYEHTSLLGTYVTFKRRAVARELGKVFGLPKENIDKLSAGLFEFKDLDELEKLVLRYSSLIEGFPNYLSVHSGGILILNDSIYNYAATFLPPKGFETIQIDMNIAEEVGIHKFDILAQRGLSKITDTLELIKQNQPEAKVEDIENIKLFKEDPNINNLLKNGDCMGVFYVESPAMRGLLIKLQTDNYLNLVAASSIIRPGVSNGGMKEEYIQRHRDPERRKEGHPVMLEIMDDTYGVMVYQEDVMKVANKFAGLSFDDADVLRRGMSGKKTSKGQIERIEAKFRENCRQRNYDERIIDEVWEQISSFAGYAFPKGHSASYAIESYQSLYLKKYFPLEFMVAALNNGGGFYDFATYVQEIRKCGGRVHPPCINKSDHPNNIFGKDIYLGLGYLKELETKTIQRIIENRQFHGPFRSFDDFIDRVPIGIEQLSILLKVNAFRFTGIDKHQLLWKAHFKLQAGGSSQEYQERLFTTKHKDFELPQLEYNEISEAFDQMEVLGFSLCNHFKLLKNAPEAGIMADKLKNYVGREVVIYGDLITVKSTGTSNGKYMSFATFYDEEGGVFDTVQFPALAEKYPLRNKGIYRCYGLVKEELDYVFIVVKSFHRQETIGDPRLAD